MSSPDKSNDPDDVGVSCVLPRLRAGTLAQFDPVSGLLVVNVAQDEFLQAFIRFGAGESTPNDAPLISAINHETYHYFQTIATGYCYREASEAARLVRQHMTAYRQRRTMRAAPIEAWRRLLSDAAHDPRLDALAALLGEQERVRDLAEREAAGETTVMGAMAPRLHPALKARRAAATRRNADGVSAIDLIEGSAMIYQVACLGGDQAGFEARLRVALADYEDPYRRAYDVARERLGARALDVLMPTIALALRYEQPADAFVPLAMQLANASLGGERDAARALALPSIAAAGSRLGTARDVRHNPATPEPWAFYDATLSKVGGPGSAIDALDLLTDVETAAKLGGYQFGFVTRDGTLVGGSRDDIAMRLFLGSVAFRSMGLSRYVRDAERRLLRRLDTG